MAIKEQRVTKYLGPWPDGLITRHEGSYDVAETFVSEIINLDVTDYGVLVQRPGFVRFHDAWTDGWPASFTNYGALRLLGSYPTAPDAGNLRLYLSQLELRGGTWKEDIFFTDDPTTGSPTLLFTNDHGASEPSTGVLWKQVVLYNGKLYFIRNGAASAGTFLRNVRMDNGDSTGATATNLSAAASAYGFYAFVMQDRVFVVDRDGSRVDYTKATDPEIWAAPDGGFFNINPNDAQRINAVISLEDIAYFFKEDSTWAFTFNTDPTVDGILRLVSKQFGAFDATNKGSDIYVVNRHGIYQFIDGSFVDIAQNIVTIMDAPDSWGKSISLTVVDDRLIVGSFYELGDFTSLCMNLRTGAWTTYAPVDAAIGPTSKRAYAVSQSNGKSWMVWGDYVTAVQEDNIDSGTGYLSMMRIGGDRNDPDNKTRDQDRLGFTWVPLYRMVTVPLALDDPTKFKKLYRWRYDIEHSDFDNDDDKPQFSVRDGDPTVVDDSQTLTTFSNFYSDFFDSVTTKQRRFKVMQFGVNKTAEETDPEAGPGIDQKTTFRIRGLSMDYAIKGPFRT